MMRVRQSSAAFLALAMSAAVAVAADDNKVIFPAGNASATPAAPAGGGLGSVTLVVGLVLAAAGGWFVWRGRMSAPLGREQRHLNIAETRSLGNRQYLVVATYQDKKFLLGVCPGRIDMLTPLHDGATAPEKPRS